MGWDCMRHYEIIKAGAIPYFPDIGEKPPLTMVEYPSKLQHYANETLMSILLKPSKIVEFESRLAKLSGEFMAWLNQKGQSDVYHSILSKAE